MNNEGGILGVIIAFELDRNGNDYVVRGALKLFNKPLIKITNDLIESLRLKETIIYTNQKGIIFKNILGKRIKYIVRKNNSIYLTNTIYTQFEEYLKNVSDILVIDPKYPFLDNLILEKLINRHQKNGNDLTYIKGLNQYSSIVPNIYIINKTFFREVFQNEYYSKTFGLSYLIEQAIANQKKFDFIEIYDIHKILMVSNGKIISTLESLLINRK